MPRRARTYLPGYPYHIVQRGNNREACFISIDDYQCYLDLWDECARRYGLCIHAWCLMTNHIHSVPRSGRHQEGDATCCM
ncbi:MAG: transposase [Candidatus Promineifilaceae bacterium]